MKKISVLFVIALLTSCGGGGGSSDSGFNVTVVAAKVAGASCFTTPINADGTLGSATANVATTDDAGLASFSANYGRMLISCSGGTYTDEATGAAATVTGTIKAAILTQAGGEYAVSPLTDLAAKRGTLNEAIDKYNSEIARQFGLGTDTSVVDTVPSDLETASSIDPDNANDQYAIILAAISQIGASTSNADTAAVIAHLGTQNVEEIKSLIATALDDLASSTASTAASIIDTTATATVTENTANTAVVASVILTATNTSVGVANNIATQVEVLPANAADTSVTYSSADTNIATVSTTGVITGVSIGTVIISATANGDSDIKGTISISVNSIPPNISTTSNNVVVANGLAINDIIFNNSGGAATYTINPPLSAGLSIDSTNGTISGVPTAVASATTYTVTASNDAGDSSATVNITVNSTPPTPPNISTTFNDVIAVNGSAIEDITFSNAGGGATYAINPSLSPGLSINSADGTISGVPTAVADATTYTVTASNDAGDDSATVNITVNPKAPNIIANTTDVSVVINGNINISFSNSGGAATYTINPSLNDGLSLNSADGTISGVPTIAGAITYTVTASNVTGDSSATVNITVTDLQPFSPPTLEQVQQWVLPEGINATSTSSTYIAAGWGDNGMFSDGNSIVDFAYGKKLTPTAIVANVNYDKYHYLPPLIDPVNTSANVFVNDVLTLSVVDPEINNGDNTNYMALLRVASASTATIFANCDFRNTDANDFDNDNPIIFQDKQEITIRSGGSEAALSLFLGTSYNFLIASVQKAGTNTLATKAHLVTALQSAQGSNASHPQCQKMQFKAGSDVSSTAELRRLSLASGFLYDDQYNTVLVTPEAVSSVAFTNTSANIIVGNTAVVSAVVQPDNATNKSVTYSSADTNIATVDATTGEVSAVAAGSTVITATSTDGGFTDTIDITVTDISIPSGLSATAAGDSINLSWNTVTDATDYEIYRHTADDNSNSSMIANPLSSAGLSYTDAGLETDITYFYWLKACVNATCSDFSAVASATTTLIVVPLNDTGITISGTNSGTATTCSTDSNIPAQDCHQGRDADTNLQKTGAGQAGFDFTKLGSDGAQLTIQNGAYSATGTAANGTKWSCVRDNVTGMIWEVKTADNKDSNYTWGNRTSLVTAANAENSGSGLCGITNWRVPGVNELLSIINYNNYTPSIDSDYFPNTANISFWSEQEVVSNTANAWLVDFNDGASIANNAKSNSFRVRLVSAATAAVSYTNNNNGTITDNTTGLMWKACDQEQVWNDGDPDSCTDGTDGTYTWTVALTEAQNHTFAGYDDWRLPNVKELASIVDYTKASQSINPLFPNTYTTRFWTSTLYANTNSSIGLPNHAWNVSFSIGIIFANGRTAPNRVRLVRTAD